MNELRGELLDTHKFWKVQNTGWSECKNWFDTGGSVMNPLRFDNEADAIAYGNQRKNKLNQAGIIWRVVQVIYDRYENGDKTTKTWVKI